MARSFFATGDAADGAARYALEDYQGARDAFARSLAASDADTNATGHGRLALMVALCDAALGAWVDAADGFATARATIPALSDWIVTRRPC
jgi:hypothetical protein